MAYTGQTIESLQAENKMYEAFLKHGCSIENDEVKQLIEEAWGGDSDWTKRHKIIVLKESSPAVIDYRIQANNEMLQAYGIGVDARKAAPPVYYEEEENDEEEIDLEKAALELKATFQEDW